MHDNFRKIHFVPATAENPATSVKRHRVLSLRGHDDVQDLGANHLLDAQQGKPQTMYIPPFTCIVVPVT